MGGYAAARAGRESGRRQTGTLRQHDHQRQLGAMSPTTEGGVFSGHDILATPLSQFLIQAIIVVMLTRLLAVGLQYVGQPRVIAEVIGGILLGPSVFGRFPHYTERIFPKDSMPALGLVANFGLVLYLFLVGIEIDPRGLIRNLRKTATVSLAGVVFPWLLGLALAPFLYQHMIEGEKDVGHVNMRSFTVFVCVAISITAFPVLARILNETNTLSTLVGNTAIGAAAVDDVVAWSLLALSIALIHADNPLTAAYIFLSVLAYAIGVLTIVRPLWGRVVQLVDRSDSHALEMSLMALAFLSVFFSAWVTEILGVHAIFGAFLFGLAMPRGHHFTLTVTERIEDIVQIVFLPLYFTLSGLKTNVGTITSSMDVLVLLVVVLTAIAAKFCGCSIGAKLTGLGWRESAAVGVLMNTRGLVELIVLNIGLEARVITDKLFTIMVLMALITTVMTTPLMTLVYPMSIRTYVRDEPLSPQALAKMKRKSPDDVNVLMVVHQLDEIPAMTALMHILKPAKRSAALRVTGAHLIESSIATTDILVARERRHHNHEPSLQMLSVVGRMVGATVETDVMVGNPRIFAEELLRRSALMAMDLAVLPHGQGMYFFGDSYENFLEEMVERATNDLVIMVNPRGSTHNLYGGAGNKREILVIVTGEEDDPEVLAIARRFRASPDVNVKLLVLNHPQKFDQRVSDAVNAFIHTPPHVKAPTTNPAAIKATPPTPGVGVGVLASTAISLAGGHSSSNLTFTNVVTLEGPTLTHHMVLEEAAAQTWDFILLGHSVIDPEAMFAAATKGPVAGDKDRGSSGMKRVGSKPRFDLLSPHGGLPGFWGGSDSSTPKGSRKAAQRNWGVLGSVATLLLESGVMSSLLVVHAGQSFMESTLSVKLAATDSTRVTIKDFFGGEGSKLSSEHLAADVAAEQVRTDDEETVHAVEMTSTSRV